MKHLIFALALNWLCAVPTQGAEGNKLPRVEQRLPDDIGKRLADQVPHPIPTSTPTNSSPTPTAVREQIFKRFATWPGLLVAAVTLALTLFICRPRGKKPHALDAPTKPRTLIEEFRASMSINYERWHDGIGYHLNLLDKGSPNERAKIETLLLVEPVTDWRIVEGLGRLRTPAAIARLQSALASTCDHEVKMAISEYAADLIPVEQRTAALIGAVREASLVKGLHLALRQLIKFHPPEISAELLRATLQREGDVAMHCAAYLLVIHGKARSLFDDEHRAFLARFATNIPDERAVNRVRFRISTNRKVLRRNVEMRNLT